MKLWGGRFNKDTNELMKRFNNSFYVDKRLYKQDIRGSIAHVKMLGRVNILRKDEVDKIINGLEEIMMEIEDGRLKLEGDFEDIHSFVESKLLERIGDVAKKLHTSRSRNDQVAVDMKMFVKDEISAVISKIDVLIECLKKKGKENEYLMPGFTHLQPAQVITFRYHLMAYVEMLKRDKKRLLNALSLLDESPLGSCALAGTTNDIDRDFTSNELGFRCPTKNYLDSVSDRDYLIEILSAFSIIMMHLSRLSEEIIIWCTPQFRFVTLSDEYSTGSSLMPQKKNPDSLELIRGKTGRVYGSLINILTILKALPLAYNKDMQEDKECFFDSLDTVNICIEVMIGVVETMKVNKEEMLKSIDKGYINATEVTDYLVKKGVPFRDAHEIVGRIVLYCEEKGRAIEKLDLDELKSFSEKIEEDLYEYIDYSNILKKGNKKYILMEVE
ncbi:argininosuccinate lyase [Caloramator proteoclasticus]|uniref:Argininosuccinate lyase n=1 Tax=Caloramator proteoclasticus DSM 10124 TaxID=1121262 RepID=A0A1M4ZA28_9CLOT|nr:argininosuccinate lyase [Caloramator proteoclasticus]SHF14913.1 argininosuccinate lyase [Caloramator proteoclasticus DSM 10124]